MNSDRKAVPASRIAGLLTPPLAYNLREGYRPSRAEEDAMPRMVRCSDTGQQCEYIARGSSDDEVMLDVARHAEEVHGLKEMPSDASERIRSMIGEE